jgi:hypothetical protein
MAPPTDGTELADARRYGGIAKDCHSRHAGRDLLEQLKPFRADGVFEHQEPGGVAAGPR